MVFIIIALFLGLRGKAVLGERSEAARGETVTMRDAAEPAVPTTSLIFVALVAAFLGRRIKLGFTYYQQHERLELAADAVARGDIAQGEELLGALTWSRFVTISVPAVYALARIDEQRGNLAEALRRCEGGISRLAPLAGHLPAADVLGDLIGERAFILAALDREAEALAALATLPASYTDAASARFRVRLVQLARCAKLMEAADLAGTGRDLRLTARDELLMDAVRVAARPEAASAVEVARLKRELGTSPEGHRWMEAVAPAALAILEKELGPQREAGRTERTQGKVDGGCAAED